MARAVAPAPEVKARREAAEGPAGGGGTTTTTTTTSATTGTGGGSCEHDVCKVGGPLAAGCSDCVTQVCGADSFCCSGGWDEQCTQEATSYCPTVNCSGPCSAETCPDG